MLNIFFICRRLSVKIVIIKLTRNLITNQLIIDLKATKQYTDIILLFFIEKPLPIFTKLKDINKFSADFMHGDYIGAALDGIDFLKTFDNLKWPIKLFLKIVEIILNEIHPIFLVIFPSSKNNGTFVDNLMFSVSRGGGVIKGALKLASLFQ